jgi:hypothetical protein
MVDERLLEILVCPECKEDVRLEDEWLVCEACAVKYPVRDGIPIMLVDEAEPLEGAEGEE